MTFERTFNGEFLQKVPGAIRDASEMPEIGTKIVIMSFTANTDDCAYSIVDKTGSFSKQYVFLRALTYTPERAPHLCNPLDPNTIHKFNYRTIGVSPIIVKDFRWSPYYVTMALRTYQELCKSGVHQPKGESGEAALNLKP